GRAAPVPSQTTSAVHNPLFCTLQGKRALYLGFWAAATGHSLLFMRANAVSRRENHAVYTEA
ncbi:hypothetical protein, partial [Vibrio viridaestus]|uniref:hypothetical protein n=1 Tax=Vibrio viridaestus TaxID=2487322 RepID=UPI001AA0A1FE